MLQSSALVQSEQKCAQTMKRPGRGRQALARHVRPKSAALVCPVSIQEILIVWARPTCCTEMNNKVEPPNSLANHVTDQAFQLASSQQERLRSNNTLQPLIRQTTPCPGPARPTTTARLTHRRLRYHLGCPHGKGGSRGTCKHNGALITIAQTMHFMFAM